MCAKLLQSCPILCDPMDCTTAHQAPPSMGFSRQEDWSGLPFPSPGDLPNPGNQPMSLMSPALAGGFFTTSTGGLGYVGKRKIAYVDGASQVVLLVKSPTANARDIRDAGSTPGLGRFPRGGHGNPLQYSCLENPMERGAWWAPKRLCSRGSQRVRHN